jgi:hypothetical protein
VTPTVKVVHRQLPEIAGHVPSALTRQYSSMNRVTALDVDSRQSHLSAYLLLTRRADSEAHEEDR